MQAIRRLSCIVILALLIAACAPFSTGGDANNTPTATNRPAQGVTPSVGLTPVAVALTAVAGLARWLGRRAGESAEDHSSSGHFTGTRVVHSVIS